MEELCVNLMKGRVVNVTMGRYVASSVFCKIKGFRNTYSSLSVMYGDTEAQGSCTY